MRWMLMSIAIGLTGCTAPVTETGLCRGLDGPVADLRGALVANVTDTPETVGEAGTRVVLGFEAGCR